MHELSRRERGDCSLQRVPIVVTNSQSSAERFVHAAAETFQTTPRPPLVPDPPHHCRSASRKRRACRRRYRVTQLNGAITDGTVHHSASYFSIHMSMPARCTSGAWAPLPIRGGLSHSPAASRETRRPNQFHTTAFLALRVRAPLCGGEPQQVRPPWSSSRQRPCRRVD